MKAAFVALVLCAVCASAMPHLQLHRAAQHMNEQAKAQLMRLFEQVNAKVKVQTLDFNFLSLLGTKCNMPTYPDDQLTRLWQNASVSSQCLSALLTKTSTQIVNVAKAKTQLVKSFAHKADCHLFTPQLTYGNCVDVISTESSNVAAFATACKDNGFYAVGFDVATHMQLSVFVTLNNNRTEYKVGGLVEVDGDIAAVPSECSDSDLSQMAQTVHLVYAQFQAAFNQFVPCVNDAISQTAQLFNLQGFAVSFSNIDTDFTITYYPRVDPAYGTVNKMVRVAATTLSSAASPLAAPPLWLAGLTAALLWLSARLI